MANYNDKARSFLAGLSDFWLLYFKEIDQIAELYKGTEILVGQAYLDLMSLLLNASVKDTLVFNKEYFKFLAIRENDIRYVKGSSPSADRFVYTLPDNLTLVRHLNNRVFMPTDALDKDVEYFVNSDDLTLEFKFDPMNAYLETTFGTDNAALRLRTRFRGADAKLVRVWLNDVGGALNISAVGYDVTINYDGPANTATTPCAAIVAAINTSPLLSGLLFAEIAGLGTGTVSPPGTLALAPLGKFEVNPLDHFGVRSLEVEFGGKITAATIPNWVTAGVEKGDILRLLSGPTVGTQEDAEINLVRQNALYVKTGATLTATAGDRVDFAVLRTPANPVSNNEPIANSGINAQSGVDGVVTAITREFSSPTAVFSPVHVGEVIELLGVLNTGFARIIDYVSPTTVVVGFNTVNEGPISWNLLTVVDPANVGVDGVLTNRGDGTAEFTSATAAFVGADVPGSVLKISRAGVLERYSVLRWVSANEVILAVPLTTSSGLALTWGWARFKTPATTLLFSPPAAWPDEGSVSVFGRRELDDRALTVGVDYTVNYLTGVISPLTVWRPAGDNTAIYSYKNAVVENVTPLQSGLDGTLTAGAPDVFTSPTAVFNTSHIGSVIRITNSGLITTSNNGDYVIAAVTSPTTVTLTPARRVSTTPDPNNTALRWGLLRRAVLATAAVTTVAESGFWCPDVLVDRFHLYNTYGYLIDRKERSSEAYRALIRGIFQLFMLGPTLERFTSAINVVAGLPVIRDDGEIFLGYSSGAEASGADGFLDFSTRHFTSASAAFTAADTTKYIYISSGFNNNRLYKIQSVVSTNTVVLAADPTTDGPVTWELTRSAEHSVQTNRTRYVFDRTVPLRTAVTDNGNVGVKFFRAFEVLTTVFECTDYVETPQWWELAQIPLEIMPNQSASRRQSSPTLYENVVGPADEGRIGDPGFYVGADSDGFVPPAELIRAGVADGTVTGDPMYPLSNNVFFDTPTGAFTASDVGNLLKIVGGAAAGSYLIVERVSATRVKIAAFTNVPTLGGQLWEIRTGTLPKRHKAAFVIWDKVVKHHVFEVTFDSALLSQLSITLFQDLEELVFAAKPTYTFIALTPGLFFQENILIGETFTEEATLALGGTVGETILGNENPLRVIGSSWLVGGWYRYIQTTGTFAAPAVNVPQPLGAPDAFCERYITKMYIQPADLTSNGEPVQAGKLVKLAAAAPAPGASITVVSGEKYINLPAGSVTDADVTNYVEITGSGLGNDGSYRIGAVISDAQVRVDAPAAVAEAGLQWNLATTGGVQGAITTDATGRVFFEDATGRHGFNNSHVGDRIRRPFPAYASNQSFRIAEVVSPSRVSIAELSRLTPSVDFVVTGGVLTVVTVGSFIFLPHMALMQRQQADMATSEAELYYVEMIFGPNTGQRFYFWEYMGPNQVRLSGSPLDGAAQGIPWVLRAPRVAPEVGDWEHVKDAIVYETLATGPNLVDLSNTPPQDPNPAVSYTVYGVQEPVDLDFAVFLASMGDTMYHVGMPDPRQHRGKQRTGRDTDMFESPISITVT